MIKIETSIQEKKGGTQNAKQESNPIEFNAKQLNQLRRRENQN
jgi:hypothetical protein